MMIINLLKMCLFIILQWTVNNQTVTLLYLRHNIQARSCNRCCSGKGITVTYSVFVFVALDIQHAMRMRHIVICDLPRSTTFSPVIP